MNIDHDEADSDLKKEARHKLPIIVTLLCVIMLFAVWTLANPTSYVDENTICNDGSLPAPKTLFTDRGKEQRFVCHQ